MLSEAYSSDSLIKEYMSNDSIQKEVENGLVSDLTCDYEILQFANDTKDDERAEADALDMMVM